MKIQKLKQVLKEEIVGFKCDVCSNILKAGEEIPEGWCSFSWITSDDNYVEKHVCCVSCYLEIIKKEPQDSVAIGFEYASKGFIKNLTDLLQKSERYATLKFEDKKVVNLKSGEEYSLLTDKATCHTNEHEGTPLVVYTDKDNEICVRNKEEFNNKFK